MLNHLWSIVALFAGIVLEDISNESIRRVTAQQCEEQIRLYLWHDQLLVKPYSPQLSPEARN
jgi:hypothetical protein